MAAASAVVDRLLRRLAFNGPEAELPSAVKEDMIHVNKALSRWHVVLENTEKQLFEGGSGEYLGSSNALMSKENKMSKIKQIAYDIEDILDEFEDYGRRPGGGSERTEEVFCCSSAPFFPTTTTSKMRMVRKTLDRESEKSIIFSLLHHSKPDLELNDDQGSFDINSIIGRDEDKENIKKIINDAGPFSIIPIVGLCGIGKTSLARLIFNDRGEDFKFDHHIWISLNMSCDLSNIVNGIISQAGNKEGTSQKNQGTLKNLVRQALTDKRSLVVLDNLWSMDRIQLDELKEILSTSICSIIVTTSSEEVAKLFNTVSPYKLGLLSDSDCWTIFSGVASKDQETRDHVVKLCQGMPVVARSLTSVVQAKGKNVWKDAKDKELWHLEKLLVPKVKMFRSLKQIYYRMPSGLKSCLGYLSIFPKGFHIDAEKLIWQWSALDMLGSNHGILPPYAQGKNYIQTLLSIFFLQALEECSANGMVLINGKNVLEMHSLVHSFARYVSSDELIIFEDQIITPIKSKKGETFRYALLLECNEASMIPKGFLTKARAISFKGCKARKLPEEALSALCHLNVLDLSGCSFLELPSSIGQLKHLRYLDVSHSGLQSLPSELRSLQNLEALDLSRNTINVPLDLIGPFEKLKYLNLQECPNLRDLLQTFGDLNGLEHLNVSGCSEVSELPETLCGFSALQLLDLSSCVELKKLPRSLGSLKNLGDLNLSGCSRLEQLPETFHELYSLKFLNLENCYMIQQLPHLFGNLKTLEFLNLSGCTSLQELPKSFGGLYFLRVLSLDGCFGLQESPKVIGNLLNLENLNLAHISLELPEALINLRRLHTLDLTGCGFKKSFDDIVNKMTNLKFVLTDDSRLALSVSRHILVSTEKNNKSCVDSHVVQSRDLEQADIVGETDIDEIIETLVTGKGTVDDANPQQETRNSFELIVEDKDSSASSKDVEFSAGTQDHTPKRPRFRRGRSALLRCSIPYAMGNCFGSPDATAKPPGPPTKGLPTTRPKAIGSDGSGMQEKGDGPEPGGLVLEAPRLRTPPKASDGSGAKQEKGRGDGAPWPGPGQVLEAPRLREFTLAELQAATRGFKPDMVLGEGSFGRVYKGWVDERTLNPTRSNAGIAVAVKKLNPESVQGLQECQSEINFLGRLSHPNLVRLLGYCGEDRELLLVYEFMPKGSLDNHLFRRGGNLEALSWSRRLKIATGVARGLAFLHSLEKPQIIYRDFKASNILLHADFTAKLSDFGLAKNGPSAGKSHVTTRIMGNYGYAAPEYVASGHLYVKSDVYGFGVVLLELLTGLRAHDQHRPSHQHNLVEWARPYLSGAAGKIKILMDPWMEGQYHDKGALRAARLAGKCLTGDPKSRPSMDDVVAALEDIF